MSEGMGAVAPASNANSVVPASVTKAASIPPAQKSEAPKPKHESTEPTQSVQPKKFKVKVDGQESEVDESELVASYQKSKAADKRFQEAAQKAKQAEQIMAALESGDIKFIEQKLGKEKAKALFEDYLIQDLEYQSLSPAEKRARELEMENKSLKELQEQEKKQRAEQEKQAYLQKAHEEIDNEVHQALSELGIKPTPRLAVRIVDEMIAKLEGKGEAMSAKDASARALKGLQTDIAEYLPTLSLEQLQQIIPPKVIDMLREGEVNRVLGDRAQRRTKPQQSSQPKPQKPVGIDEYFKQLEKKINK
jgi:hypothetical protein